MGGNMFKKIDIKNNLSDLEMKEQFIDLGFTEHIKNKLLKLITLVEQIEELFKKKDYDKIIENNRKMIYTSEEITQMIRQIPSNVGIKDNYSHLNEMNIKYSLEPDEVTFEVLEKDVIHITLKDLLPRRADDNKKHENRDYIRYKYTKAFHVFSKSNFIEYKERVIVLFKNYFVSMDDMVDYDNLDPKIIMDIITTYFLIDDNPQRYIKIEDYGIHEKRHSEIYIIPLHKWLNYIELPFL